MPLARFLHDDEAGIVREHVWGLTVARWCSNVAFRLVVPYFGVIAAALGVPLTTIGVAASAGELSGLSGPFVGHAIERRTRRGSMVTGAFGLAIATATIAASSHIAVFAVGLITLAISKGLFDNAMGSWVADHTPFSSRGRVSGVIELSWAISLLVGIPLLGLVAGLWSWRAAFVVASVLIAAAGVRLRATLPAEAARTGVTRHHRLRIDRTNIAGYATFALVSASANCLFVTWGSWFRDVYGWSNRALGTIGIAFGAAELLACVLSARFVDRIGKRRAVIAGAWLMIPAGLMLGRVHGSFAAVATLAVFFLGFEFAIVSFVPLIATLQPEAPAMAFGVAGASGTLARGIVAVASTRLYAAHGMAGSGVLSAACAAAIVLVGTIALKEPT